MLPWNGMKRALVASGLLVALLLQAPALAHGFQKGDLHVRHPWTRATPLGATVGVGYLEIRNSGKNPDRLIGASTAAAERVELHILEREREVMKMREAKELTIPARARLVLRPGGPHLMLVGLRKPFAKGERIPLTLRFEKAGDLPVELEVQALDSRKAHH
jgi:copper(I)-binding protein